MSDLRDRKPKYRPGFEWQYREGCQCEQCPKGNCRGKEWPHWKDVARESASP